MYFLLNKSFVIWMVGLYVEERGVVFRPQQSTQGLDGQELPAALAVLDDSRDAEGVVEDGNAVTHPVCLAAVAGKEIIHDHVIRVLEWPTGEEDKRPQGVETLVVDAPNGFNGSLRGKLLNDRRRNRDMGQLAQHVGNLCRGRCPADPDQKCLIGGTNDQVRSNAVGLGAVALDHAHHDAHNR